MSRSGALYRNLAERLQHQIETDVWRPGGRLPSVRDLSRSQKVSVSTVLQAYTWLETRGLIEARPQSGYYVKPQGAVPSLKLSRVAPKPCEVVSQDALLNVIGACGNPKYVPLGAAVVDRELLPWEALTKSLSRIARQRVDLVSAYGSAPGNDEYLREVARRSLALGCDFAPEDVQATLGAMEAIGLALAATTRPGDVVAVESPTYHGTIEALRSRHLRVLEIAVDPREGLDLDDLEAKLAEHPVRALLVSPNFNNPLGSLMSDERKQRLAKIAAVHGLPVIEDDVYGDLAHGEVRPKTLKAFDRKDWVLLCSGFSKTLAPGFRAGWIAPGPRFSEAVRKHKFASTVCSVTATHMATADYLRNNSYERHLRRLGPVLCEQVHRLSRKVLEVFPDGTRLSTPQGGFVLWVELPGRVDTFALHRRSLARGVSLVPGPLFSPTARFKNFIRLNAGACWGPALEKGVEIIAEELRRRD